MNDVPDRKAFARRAAFDQPELVGARWWRQGLRLAEASPARRRTLGRLAIAAGVVGFVGVVAAIVVASGQSRSRSFDAGSITRTSIDAQRADGWNVGESAEALDYPDACEVDATGERYAAAAAQGLAADLAPARKDLAPWYVSTLFQSLELPANADLRAGLRPIFSKSMDAAFGRGESVRSLFEGPETTSDVAVIADLPGPEAVAFAAGLAPQFVPVFAFDNWPHPRGVVPAHLTLAAAVYYRRWFDGHAAGPAAPPVFVLDRARLSPYVDDAGRFDNRYVAKLPTAEAFAALGVKHVLYVAPAGEAQREMDDLNEVFVAYHAAGLDVKILSLSDLAQPDAAPAGAPRPGAPVAHSYYYGGYPHTHYWFWNNYRWRAASASSSALEPAAVSRGFDFVPSPRPTLFSSGLPAGAASGANPRPRGFGTTTFHPPSTSGNTPGRSGSFGRSGSSFSG